MTIDFTGNILTLKKHIAPKKPYIAKEIFVEYDPTSDFITLDLIKRGNIDASLVALTSTIMNVACWYSKKDFVIDLLQGCTAQLEQEKFVESGKKLN